MSRLTGLRTLVLRPDFTPISLLPLHTVPVEEAYRSIMLENSYEVETYDRVIKTAQPKFRVPWPSVMVSKNAERWDRSFRPTPFYLLLRDDHECAYCGKFLTMDEVTMDHVIPKSKGGTNDWDNVVASCGPCNHSKTNKDPVGRWKPSKKPFVPNYWVLLKQSMNHQSLVVDNENWIPYLGMWKGEFKVRKV